MVIMVGSFQLVRAIGTDEWMMIIARLRVSVGW
nr:MAG TPA: hypothetical protein [Caudoviricetes sp.]